VALGVHALDVGIVVLALSTHARSTRTISPAGATHQQANTGACRSATIAAQRSAGYRADRRTDNRAGHCRLSGSIFSRLATDLNMGVLATVAIILAEAFDAIPASRQNHDGRPGRQHGTSPQKERTDNNRGASRNNFSLGLDHFSGCGKTFCQPPGHSLT
jgi:hypothetical protein